MMTNALPHSLTRPPLNNLSSRYHLHERLGMGGMGTVYRATDRWTGTTVALKRTSTVASPTPDPDETLTFGLNSQALTHEYHTLVELHHPNIIRVYDYGLDENAQPFFTMPLLEGAQDILKASRTLKPEGKLDLLRQLLDALAYLHQHGIIHRDVKPANILVVGGVVKLLDFGLAISPSKPMPLEGRTVGTLYYVAPEVLQGDAFSEASDLYAVGMIAYEMFAGAHPFRSNDVMDIIDGILNRGVDVTLLDVDERTAALIARLTARNSEVRYANAHDVLADLWVTVSPRTKAQRHS
jgi:eukaryotic-like serine/threonine-protein kinase